MPNTRTNTLHKNLPAGLRRQVESALVEQPPECPSYAAVFERFGLADYGVSIKAVERYGKYLRLLHRNSAIAELKSAIADQQLGSDVVSMLYGKLFLRLAEEDDSPGEILKLAAALRDVRRSEIDGEVERRRKEFDAIKLDELRNKKKRADAALERKVKSGEISVDVAAEIRDLYGVVIEGKRGAMNNE